MILRKTYINLETILFSIVITLIMIFLAGRHFELDAITKINDYEGLNIFYGRDTSIYGGTLFRIILVIVSIDMFQKMILFLTLFLSIFSSYSLAEGMTSSRIAKFYVGFLYVFNPFTYIRILAGNWYLLFAYAILPLLVKSFIDILQNNDKKNVIKFVILVTMAAFNIHILIIALIIMSIIFMFWISKYGEIRNIKIIPIAIIIFIFLNFYWIFPLVTTKNTIIDNIGEEDYKVFAPKVDNLSDLFSIASMYGFWREGYIYAKDFIPYWQLLSLLIISLAIYGFISYYKDEKIGYLVKAFGVIGIIGFILATGINGPFGGINHWLYDNTILKGFRDSHKFVAMMGLAYTVLGGLGVNKIRSMVERFEV